MFNNKIYGLTKGQYSPTSDTGQYSKSSPYGNVEHPLNPISLSIAAKATFIARTLDKDAGHLQEMIIASKSNKGASFLEIYQNCPIFNDGVYDQYTNKASQNNTLIRLEDQKPLFFGENNEKAIIIEGLKPRIVNKDEIGERQLWIHDSSDLQKANMIAEFSIGEYAEMPLPVGIIYKVNRDIAQYNEPEIVHSFDELTRELERGYYLL
jgi:2-oxoglutarate ferredoxin oxidoreductase subunit beta